MEGVEGRFRSKEVRRKERRKEMRKERKAKVGEEAGCGQEEVGRR